MPEAEAAKQILSALTPAPLAEIQQLNSQLNPYGKIGTAEKDSALNEHFAGD